MSERDVVPRLLSGARSLGRPAPIPNREGIEQAFGEDLGDVSMRVGAAEIGAGGATVEDTMVFADPIPGLHLVAHEAAHVVQNRRATQPPARALGPADGPAEAEASAAADAVMGGATVEVSATPGGAVQGGGDFLKKLLGRKEEKALTDEDLDTTAPSGGRTVGSGTTANRTDVVTYKKNIGSSDTNVGFFKPEGTSKSAQGMTARTIASSRLDKILGFNLQPDERIAEHGGDVGSVSPKLAARFQQTQPKTLFDKVVTDADIANDLQFAVPPINNPTPQQLAETRAAWAAEDPARYQLRNGVLYEQSGAVHMRFDYSNPVTQKELFDLQMLDWITMQRDRHGGNIFIDRGTGQVRGIDNDMAFGSTTDVKGGFGKNLGVPPLLDKGTAARLRDLDITEVLSALNAGLPKGMQLPDDEQKALIERIYVLGGILRGAGTLGYSGAATLTPYNPLLVEHWSAGTFGLATRSTSPDSYLKRQVDTLTNLRQGHRRQNWELSKPAGPGRALLGAQRA